MIKVRLRAMIKVRLRAMGSEGERWCDMMILRSCHRNWICWARIGVGIGGFGLGSRSGQVWGQAPDLAWAYAQAQAQAQVWAYLSH